MRSIVPTEISSLVRGVGFGLLLSYGLREYGFDTVDFLFMGSVVILAGILIPVNRYWLPRR